MVAKLARPACDCARGFAAVEARSCERRITKLALEAKRGDHRQQGEGGREAASGSGGREGGVAGLGRRSAG